MKAKFTSGLSIFVCCITLICSCGGAAEGVSIPGDFNSEKIISNQNHLQKIVTKEMVAKVVNVPLEKIEEHVENNISQKGQYTVLYSWPTGKTKTISEQYSIADYQSIGIGFVSKMHEAGFEKKFGTNDGLQEQVNQMAAQENFNKETAIAEAQYLSDYAQRRSVEKLENIATAAYWEHPVNALHVLAGDVSFTITTNFGDDDNMAKKKSIELVKAILNN